MHLVEIKPLSEIHKIASIPKHGIDLNQVTGIKIIKNNYLDDYYIEQGKIKDYLVFCVRLSEGDRTYGHKLVAVLMCQEVDDLKTKNNHKPVMVVRTWCEKEYRNKGIVTNLYRFLYNELKFAILSDIEQTPETISVWNKVREYWPVQMINLDTGETQDIDDKVLYDQKQRFVLIVERLSELPQNSKFFKVMQRSSEILEDYRFNMDGL